jgi:hypothetical protein
VLNDDFIAPHLLSGDSVIASGSNTGAGKEAGEPDHAGYAGGASVWFQWTAGLTGAATIDTCDSSFDTLLGVYTGSAVDDLTEVAANDDATPACSSGIRQSSVAFPVTDGTTYRIAVDGYQGATGSIALDLSATDDVTPPQTTITGGPTGTTSVSDVSFEFTSNEPATFECELDSGGFSDCSSPQGYTGLAEGPHTFAVRATDDAGNVDPSPATADFTVDLPDDAPPADPADPGDTSAPQTTIDSGPRKLRKGRSATFRFSASEDPASFECSVDARDFEPCSSPLTIRRPRKGRHMLEVRAVDTAGNVDASPASRPFKVKPKRRRR